jgi:hypothetical protein
MSLRFVSDDAKHDARRQGKQSAGSQGCNVSAEKHCVDNDGKKGNARIETEDLAKASAMESGARIDWGKNRVRPALHRGGLRVGARGLTACRAESAGFMNLAEAMSACKHSRLLVRFLDLHVLRAKTVHKLALRILACFPASGSVYVQP